MDTVPLILRKYKRGSTIKKELAIDFTYDAS
jgi:hypothetical protein